MNVKVVTVELGKFLKKEDRDYEDCKAVYDHKHSYKNKRLWYVPSLFEAKEIIKEYVNKNKNCYGIASNGYIQDTDLEDPDEFFIIDLNRVYKTPVYGENFAAEDVLYSMANFGSKKEPKIEIDFIKIPKRRTT